MVEGVFRYGSDSYIDLFEEARTLHAKNKIQLSEVDQHLIENTDIGKWGEYNEMRVPLDCPFQIHESEYQGKDVENKGKSIALGLTFQHPCRTLTDSEINSCIDTIVSESSKVLGAKIRS